MDHTVIDSGQLLDDTGMRFRRRPHTQFITVSTSDLVSSDDNERVVRAKLTVRAREMGMLVCGYHAAILPSGILTGFRPMNDMGSASPGLNDVSVGVYLVGALDGPTLPQLDKLQWISPGLPVVPKPLLYGNLTPDHARFCRAFATAWQDFMGTRPRGGGLPDNIKRRIERNAKALYREPEAPTQTSD